MIFYSGSGV
jgi:hypothetical protein